MIDEKAASEKPKKAISAVKFSTLAAVLLTALCFLSLPRPRAWFRPDPTPFDNGPTRSVAPAVVLLREAARILPAGATVIARQMPANALADTYFHRAAVALLPRQTVLPAALKSVPTPRFESKAEFLVILGQADTYSGFEPIVRTPRGSIWRRVR